MQVDGCSPAFVFCIALIYWKIQLQVILRLIMLLIWSDTTYCKLEAAAKLEILIGECLYIK